MKLLRLGLSLGVGLILSASAINAADAPTGAPTANIGDNALLDTLVQKGVLSSKEAQDILAKQESAMNQPSADKLHIGSAFKDLTLFGDLRIRYEMRDATTPVGMVSNSGAVYNHGDSQTMNRFRYMLHFGVKGNLYDNFFFGIRASTNPNYDRSGNVSFGHSDAAGPFGKDQSLIAIDQVYLGYHAPEDVTLMIGQMPNQLYTTGLVWDPNLNPAGATEMWKYKIGDNAEFYTTWGQYNYQEAAGNGIWNSINPTGGGTGGVNNNFDDTYMLAEQIGFKYDFDKDTFYKMGFTFYTYTGTESASATSVASLYSTTPIAIGAPNASPSYFNGPFVGAASAPTSNVTGINNLAVAELPMEVDFKIDKVPIRVFGDMAYNTEAAARADAARGALNALAAAPASAGNTGVTGTGTASTTQAMLASRDFQGVLNSGKGFMDQSAFQIGVEAGELKKKGDWDGKLFYQSTGYYAVDPNLIDADIFNAAPNMQGIVASVSHNWTDGLSSTLRYGYGFRVNDQMATPNVNQDLQVSTMDSYQLIQVDLALKF